MKKELTKEEYLQLQGLFFIGTEASKKWQEYEKAIDKLVGFPENEGSLFGDALVSFDRTVDEILEILDIKVID